MSLRLFHHRKMACYSWKAKFTYYRTKPGHPDPRRWIGMYIRTGWGCRAVSLQIRVPKFAAEWL